MRKEEFKIGVPTPKGMDLAKQICFSANGYLLAAAAVLKLTKHQDPNLEYSSPVVTLLAFSLELYFKCLLVLQNGTLTRQDKQHDLKHLFDRLHIRTQASIRTYFSMPGVEEFRKIAISELGVREGDDFFDWCLTSSRNAFETFRYLFELGNNPVQFSAQRTVQATALAVHDLHPEFFTSPNISTYLRTMREGFQMKAAVARARAVPR